MSGSDTEFTETMREASGKVSSTDPLVSFLYLLMRDELPTGTVVGLLKTCSDEKTVFTNGWLAKMAIYVAERLRKK